MYIFDDFNGILKLNSPTFDVTLYRTYVCDWRLLYTRIYQRKRYRTDFSARASVHGTLKTFTVEILNHSRRTARPVPRWRPWPRNERVVASAGRLCNGGSSLSQSPTREVNVLRGSCPPLVSFCIVSSCVPSPSLLFFSRGLVFILATTGRRMPAEASEGYEARRSEQVRYRLTWNLISARCHRPRIGKRLPFPSLPRRFPPPCI